MNAFTIGGYLFGRRTAIEAVVQAPGAVWLGLLLVFSAGLARFYDQADLVHQPWWMLRPVAISLAISLVMYMVFWLVDRGWRWGGSTWWNYWRRFLPLFWLAAPVAWLYGIPFERLADRPTATAMNLSLLGIVSLWRVALLSRALAVAFATPVWRSGLCVLLVGDSLILSAAFVWGMELVALSMSTVPPTPSEVITGSVVSGAGVTAFIAWPFCLLGVIAAAIFRRRRTAAPDLAVRGSGRVGRSGWVLAVASIAVWFFFMPATQGEQIRRRSAERLLAAGRFDEAVAYMSKYSRDQFPPQWDPPPDVALDPLGVVQVTHLAYTTDCSPWVRRLFLEKLQRLLSDPYLWSEWYFDRDLEFYDRLVTVLEKLPPDSPILQKQVDPLLQALQDRQSPTWKQLPRERMSRLVMRIRKARAERAATAGH